MKRLAIAAAWVAALVVAVEVGGDDQKPATVGVALAAAEAPTVQGKGVHWWSRHAVQARRDANARGQTIRILRASLRGGVDYAPRRGLASSRPTGLTQALLCIHGFEGGWNAATGNGYHGGIQMDAQFERTYGAEFVRAWGHAENWPPFVQLTVGMRAYLSGRGFAPWPATSRLCGLR